MLSLSVNRRMHKIACEFKETWEDQLFAARCSKGEGTALNNTDKVGMIRQSCLGALRWFVLHWNSEPHSPKPTKLKQHYASFSH